MAILCAVVLSALPVIWSFKPAYETMGLPAELIDLLTAAMAAAVVVLVAALLYLVGKVLQSAT